MIPKSGYRFSDKIMRNKVLGLWLAVMFLRFCARIAIQAASQRKFGA